MLYSVLSILATAGTALAGPGWWYTVPNAPADGFESVQASFNIDPSSTHITGYYAAAQWSFKGHDVHYFGVQPHTPGTTATNGHITYSVFGPGSKPADPERCYQGADGGSGASCAFQYNIDYGRWYTITSTVVERTADGSRRWNGTVTDDQGVDTYIASFWTDSSYGALSGGVTEWLEWYPFNGDGLTPQTRPCQPYFKMHYRRPSACGNVGVPGQPHQNSLDDKCANAAGTPNWKMEFESNSDLLITAGFLNK